MAGSKHSHPGAGLAITLLQRPRNLPRSQFIGEAQSAEFRATACQVLGGVLGRHGEDGFRGISGSGLRTREKTE